MGDIIGRLFIICSFLKVGHAVVTCKIRHMVRLGRHSNILDSILSIIFI